MYMSNGLCICVYMCSRERLYLIVRMKDNMHAYICVYTGVCVYVSA